MSASDVDVAWLDRQRRRQRRAIVESTLVLVGATWIGVGLNLAMAGMCLVLGPIVGFTIHRAHGGATVCGLLGAGSGLLVMSMAGPLSVGTLIGALIVAIAFLFYAHHRRMRSFEGTA